MEDYYKELGSEFNDVRQRMARIPKGASLIKNDISAAPGFNIENVYVFAGIQNSKKMTKYITFLKSAYFSSSLK